MGEGRKVGERQREEKGKEETYEKQRDEKRKEERRGGKKEEEKRGETPVCLKSIIYND